MLKVEYLLFKDKKSPYLNTNNSFINILNAIDGVKAEEGNIEYNGIIINFDNSFVDNEETIINSNFNIENKSDIEKFEMFLRDFRKIASSLATGKRIEVLWDDIGFYYGNLAYPIIHIIENKMRKLITEFMYINAGANWESTNVPNEVEKSIKGENAKENISFLDKVDFIQLTKFLFTEYSLKDSNKIISFIKNYNKPSILTQELKDYLPVSNWDRFFKPSINIDGVNLERKWDKLYRLRCKVAHSNKLTRSDYNEIKKLSEDLTESLDKAFGNLSEITLTEVEKTDVINNLQIRCLNSEIINKKIDLNRLKEFRKVSLASENEIKSENYYPKLINNMIAIKDYFNSSKYVVANLENWLHCKSHICFKVFDKLENEKYIFIGEMKGCIDKEKKMYYFFERPNGEWLDISDSFNHYELGQLINILIDKI